MKTKGARKVGRFSVEFEVVNHTDLVMARMGLIPQDKVRRQILPGVVDSGAKQLVLPKAVVDHLGIEPTGETKVRYANGHVAMRETVEGVYVNLLGRHSTFAAVVEPKRKDALIGAIVLEDLDYLVDCSRQKLVPRDPHTPISEIE